MGSDFLCYVPREGFKDYLAANPISVEDLEITTNYLRFYHQFLERAERNRDLIDWYRIDYCCSFSSFVKKSKITRCLEEELFNQNKEFLFIANDYSPNCSVLGWYK